MCTAEVSNASIIGKSVSQWAKKLTLSQLSLLHRCKISAGPEAVRTRCGSALG